MRRPVPRRKIVTGIALVAGSVAGAVVFRRRSTRRRDRVDVYFEDGSMISLGDGSPEASTSTTGGRLRPTPGVSVEGGSS